MKTFSSLFLATLIAASGASALAQSAATTTPPSMPAMGASMPMDCSTASMKRHDHGAERNLGAAASAMPCAAGTSASAPVTTAKRKAHDHAKFHKNQ